MVEPIPVSVVVLAWNGAADLPGCLDAIAASRGIDAEVIVVDNASSDGSDDVAAAHPSAPAVVRNPRNLGCAGGNNAGWRLATRPYVVFVNPDCTVDPDAIRRLVEPLARDAGVGLTGARLFYPDSRRVQHAGGFLLPNGIAGHFGVNEEDDARFSADRECDYVTGALFAVRRADLQALGGFDEEYFPAYYEEVDLCERLRSGGRRTLYVGGALGFHRESTTLGGRASARLVRMSSRCRMVFLIKTRTAGRLLRETIPYELRWFAHPERRGFRRSILRSWLDGAIFAVRCLARGKRRPSGTAARLQP